MRAIAEVAMRGHWQAVAVILVTAFLPLTFWLSAAVVGLVILRKGISGSLYTLLMSVVPAFILYSYQGSSFVIAIFVSVMVLASVLRSSVSWAVTLMVSSLLGCLVTWVLISTLPEVFFAEMQVQLSQVMTEVAQTSSSSNKDMQWLEPFVKSVPGIAVSMLSLGCLVLSRWWQASLYNPGGFQTEFHQIRLPLIFTFSVLMAVLLGSQLDVAFVTWVVVLTLPIVIAGIALVHAIVKIKHWSWAWLAAMYLFLIAHALMVGTLLILLVLMDSYMNIRERLKDKV